MITVLKQTMNTTDFVYVTETSKSFEQAVVDVLKTVEKKGWGLFQVYDVQERLAAKSFSSAPLKIIEICSAKYASRMLQKNPLASICMPCKINIAEENGKVRIFAPKPTLLAAIFSEFSREELLEVENELKTMVDDAAK